MAAATGRRVDHLVMPVESLEESSAFFRALGFAVAPEAVHPFGTKNACVFLADGSYIEPIAIASRETCEAEVRHGNPFVARDQAHRFRTGVPSFSGLAFSSTDAEADLVALREGGFGIGETLEFRRNFKGPDGTTGELGFRLAFAQDRRAPDVFFFTCQPLHAVAPDRSALTRHENGVRGLSRVVFGEPNPSDFQYLLQSMTGDREMNVDSFSMTLQAGPATIEVSTPEALSLRYGVARDERRGLSFEGIVLVVDDLARMEQRVERLGLPAERRSGRMVVPLSRERRSFIAFEEIR